MKRYAGVLLPVTSLPSKYGIGCFDQAAYDFVDWLQKAGQRYWQILPLGATSYGLSDDSPYQAYSAFAGNPYLISLDALVEEGVLTREECDGVSFGGNPAKVDFDKLHEHRFALLHKAYERSGISADADYQNFIRDNGWWLNDYALFMALKTFFHDQPFRALAGGYPDALGLCSGALQPGAVLRHRVPEVHAVQIQSAVEPPEGLRQRQAYPDRGGHPHLRIPRRRGCLGASRAVPAGRTQRPHRHRGLPAGCLCRGRSGLGKSPVQLGFPPRHGLCLVGQPHVVQLQALRRGAH